MHVPGWDYVDQTIALMHAWPGVYAEASVVNSVVPPEAHAAAVRRLFDEGLGHRLMLGSDNVGNPAVFEQLLGRKGVHYSQLVATAWR